MISQLTVFLSNEKGRLAGMCRAISDADINMHSLFVADTEDFGVVRIICDTPQAGAAALKEAGYRASVTQVLGIRLPNEKGGLASVLEFMDEHGINVEYGYCFLANKDTAIDVLKVNDASIEERIVEAGFISVAPEEIYIPDAE